MSGVARRWSARTQRDALGGTPAAREDASPGYHQALAACRENRPDTGPAPAVRAAIERRTQAMARWIQVTTLLFTGLAMVMGVQLVVPLLSHVHIRFGTEGTPLVGAVTTSVHHYLAIHTAGMALSPRQGYSVWLASGVGLLVLATITRSVAARGTWTAWGLASIAMVWSGSTAASRPVAAAIAAIGWGLASIAALHGIGRRTKTTTINLTNEITPPVETGTTTPVDSA